MSTRPILLIGAHGQLGRELARSLTVLGPLHALGRAELDLTDADAIARVVDDVRPGLIDTPQGQADLKLIVDTCYAAILNCDDPAVRWQAARLLQNLGPMKGTLQ